VLWLLGALMLVTWGPLDSLVGIRACDAQGFPSGCEDRYTVVGTIAFYVGVALRACELQHMARKSRYGRRWRRPLGRGLHNRRGNSKPREQQQSEKGRLRAG